MVNLHVIEIGAVVIAVRRELVDAGAALLERFVAVLSAIRPW